MIGAPMSEEWVDALSTETTDRSSPAEDGGVGDVVEVDFAAFVGHRAEGPDYERVAVLEHDDA